MITISISELRADAANILARVCSKLETYIVLQRSKPKAVLVDYDYYQSLEEAALDASDSREAERAKKEPRTELTQYSKRRFGA